MNPEEALSLVRPCILALDPYSTARDECGDNQPEVFLDANESPYENGINRYPDPRQKVLKEKVAALKGISADRLFLGNGSDEAIDLLYRVFCNPGEDNAVSIAPSYGMYGVAAAMNDIAFRPVPLRADFSLDEAALLAACDAKTKLLFLCSPNNPSGNVFPQEQIERLLESFPGILVVDEAYIDFASTPSLLPLLDRYPRLVILQTLSKAWGMAGLRIGYGDAVEQDGDLVRSTAADADVGLHAHRPALPDIDTGDVFQEVVHAGGREGGDGGRTEHGNETCGPAGGEGSPGARHRGAFQGIDRILRRRDGTEGRSGQQHGQERKKDFFHARFNKAAKISRFPGFRAPTHPQKTI